ncbi:hypothetical protein [Serinicoccus marinus]|uniref:hypothetical protein n=1 Tax=Serinicoccus marinus TaxID=247333 RepID=UPI002490D87F|nr:hypothetical protein [Serinicoccus marinus]
MSDEVLDRHERARGAGVAVGNCSLVQLVEDRGLLVAGDAILIDPQLAEAGDIEVSPRRVRGGGVGAVRVFKEPEMATEHLRADPELVAGLGEPLLGGRTFDLNLAQPGADLLARQRVILSEVEQLFLTDGQLGQLLAVAVV